MSRTAEDDDLHTQLKTLASDERTLPDPSMIAAVIETVLSSLSGDMSVVNLKLYQELEELGDFIQSAKREIAAIQPHDIRERHIPMATDELDAVVDATAVATGTILGAAEMIEKRSREMPPETAAAVQADVTRIYEACNFQDITGQRITKVVGALKHIETRIDALLAAFGNDLSVTARPVEPPDEEKNKLVNGPQLPANANNQDEIDAILASFD
jgi:chemotaxis protein CheZ